ncbi:MAG: sulfur carrier protein ThiS [Rhodanobacteraceae bacterium]|nr:sulfur carrier protein ThiS [Rhodanobacteraceae bacterium]MBK7043992.1 sulfur carrier protein ThiS [Rhodanobacteraceae bacterium]MBP9155766.1 sulfur carrier protein ThiS [Xanthomonadales bacterium]HQW81713.1 sulfur carrier protein ThiS [Pseudomonadota bacterium]
MNILLNGIAQELRDGAVVAELLMVAGLAEKRVAVEVNLDIVPRSRHATHVLCAGDRVEIVHAIGGG